MAITVRRATLSHYVIKFYVLLRAEKASRKFSSQELTWTNHFKPYTWLYLEQTKLTFPVEQQKSSLPVSKAVASAKIDYDAGLKFPLVAP